MAAAAFRRRESTSKAGCIQASAATHALLTRDGIGAWRPTGGVQVRCSAAAAALLPLRLLRWQLHTTRTPAAMCST